MRPDRPPWWPEGEAWPPRGGPGGQAWKPFGRRLKRALLVLVLLMVTMSLAGGFLAAAAFGTGVGGLVLVWLVVAGGVLAALILGRRAVGPVDALVGAAEALAEGDHSVRVPVTGPPATRRALESFNEMAERLAQADQQRRRLLADVGHELRTPLAIIRGEMEAMVDGVRPISQTTVSELLDDIAVMDRLLEDLRALSLSESQQLPLHLEQLDLTDLVTDLVADLQPSADEVGVSLRCECPVALPLTADGVRVRGILGNLVVNAIRATGAGGRVVIAVRPQPGRVHVEVDDDGVGMPESDHERIFERFHKGADSRGTGLGLTISRRYALAHGGDLTVRSTPAEGSTFTLVLPLGHD